MRTKAELLNLLPSAEEEFDVIVAGAGPAGLGAAATAAEMGAKTLLLESRGFPGGVCAIAPWMPLNRLFLDGHSRGIHQMFADALVPFGPAASIPGRQTWVDGDNLNIHPEYLKLAVCGVLEDLGCHYCFHSPVSGVIKEGNVVRGVRVAGKRGDISYRGRVVVDATGDADIAFFAGTEMVSGREDDGIKMFVSLCFSIANCDVDKFFSAYPGGWLGPIPEAAKTGKYRMARWYSLNRGTIPGVLGVNNGGPVDAGDIDAVDPSAKTLVERLGFETAVDFVRLARDFRIPGLENCHLMTTGAEAAVRETRRIVGDHILTIEECCAGVEFEDVVARRYGSIDAAGLDPDKGLKMVSGHAYPYRCMLPKGIEGLLVAGRCGSTTHLAQAAGKSMGNMMALGQAAGVAAAIAARRKVTPRNMPASEIQKQLISMGVPLFPTGRTALNADR